MNCNLLISKPWWRTSKLQQPSKREHSALQKKKFINFSIFLDLFCPPGSGSTTLQNTVNAHAAQTEKDKAVCRVLAWISCFWWGSPTRIPGSSAPRTLEETAALFIYNSTTYWELVKKDTGSGTLRKDRWEDVLILDKFHFFGQWTELLRNRWAKASFGSRCSQDS